MIRLQKIFTIIMCASLMMQSATADQPEKKPGFIRRYAGKITAFVGAAVLAGYFLQSSCNQGGASAATRANDRNRQRPSDNRNQPLPPQQDSSGSAGKGLTATALSAAGTVPTISTFQPVPHTLDAVTPATGTAAMRPLSLAALHASLP